MHGKERNKMQLKKITFSFPVFYDRDEVTSICWDENLTRDTVVLLSKGVIDS